MPAEPCNSVEVRFTLCSGSGGGGREGGREGISWRGCAWVRIHSQNDDEKCETCIHTPTSLPPSLTLKMHHCRQHQIGIDRLLQPGLIDSQYHIGPIHREGQSGEVRGVGQATVEGIGREPVAARPPREVPRGHRLEDGRVGRVVQTLLDIRDDVIHWEAMGELAALAGVSRDDLLFERLDGRMEVGLILARAWGREGGREGGS